MGIMVQQETLWPKLLNPRLNQLLKWILILALKPKLDKRMDSRVVAKNPEEVLEEDGVAGTLRAGDEEIRTEVSVKDEKQRACGQRQRLPA